MQLPEMLRRPRTWFLAVPLIAVLVLVVGPFVYINVLREDAPDELSFADSTAATTTTAAADGSTSSTTAVVVDGTYAVADGSRAGYRVKEVLAGQDVEAVGRTSDVTGELVVADATIASAAFTVDMTTVASDEERRDNQFRTRIMDTATYPTAAFELTEPIALDAVPADGEEITVAATGELTIRGVARPVTFDLAARRTGTSIEVDGAIPVEFADHGIPDASFGPAMVQDNGQIEFLLAFAPA